MDRQGLTTTIAQQLQALTILPSLHNALRYAANEKQKEILLHYIESFQSGDLAAFRKSQKCWVKDVSPSIDNIMGFVEPYRDPHGIRAEWEGIVCVADPAETEKMKAFVENAAKFSKLLPWATADNDGKGPFEKASLEIPGFTIMHGSCCRLFDVLGYID
jgi:dipeptidyl-peptidase-3